jgi:hypothetical protein
MRLPSPLQPVARRFAALLLLAPLSLAAGTPAPANPAAAAAPAEADDTTFIGGVLTAIDDSHHFLSDSLIDLSLGLDDYFAGERFREESNRTYADLQLLSILDRDGGLTFANRVNVRLHLPRLERRLSVELTNEEARTATTDVQIKRDSSPQESIKNETLSAGVRWLVAVRELVNVSLKSGIKLKDAQLDPFAILRARESFRLGQWQNHLTQELFIYESVGQGATARINFERPFSARLSFRSSTFATWWERSREYDMGHFFTLHQPLPDFRAVTYEIATIGKRDGASTRAIDHYLLLRFRSRIWRPWLLYEISPQLHHFAENDFTPSPYLLLSLPAIFGREVMP